MFTILPIAQYGNTVLTCKSLPVENIDDNIFTLLGDMAETMYVAKGIGLAAPQISKLLRVIVINDSGKIKNLINPIIHSCEGTVVMSEGCLSIPGIFFNIERPKSVVVEYTNEQGKAITEKMMSLSARIVQHEMDHIDGKLILDHLDQEERSRILKKIRDDWRSRLGR